MSDISLHTRSSLRSRHRRPRTLSPTEDVVALIAQGSTIPPRIVTCTLGVGSKQNISQPRIHRFSTTETIPQGDLSTPEDVTWPSSDGETVHGLYYAPHNEAFVGRGKPPAIVQVHGGPTSQYVIGYHAQAQFFTSRGYAVLQVNHRGSTGYGRAYREALNGRWGIVDVEDTAAGARFLAQSEQADGKRLVIMGGSAGGYTVLRCLTEHPGLFRAALCLYGVSDLFRLALETQSPISSAWHWRRTSLRLTTLILSLENCRRRVPHTASAHRSTLLTRSSTRLPSSRGRTTGLPASARDNARVPPVFWRGTRFSKSRDHRSLLS